MVAYAVAEPDYNYQQPQQQAFLPSASFSNSGVVSAIPFSVLNQPQYVSSNGAQYAPQSQYVANVPHYSVSASTPGVQQFFASTPAAPVISSSKFQYQKAQQKVVVNKEIFIHSAPEEAEVIGEEIENPGPIRQNYRVVFIKAPVQNLHLNLHALKRSQAANEEKTVIYVLSKKHDLTNLQSQLANIQSKAKPSKPEVFFIKYKTLQEANRAQQEIQSQYGALGGSTRISDEVVAPVTSVIGGTSALGGIHGGSSLGGINIGSVGSSFVSSGSAASNSVNFGSAADKSVNFDSIISHRTSSGGTFGSIGPSNEYLPVIKKK